MSSCAKHHTGLCRELASYGVLVIALDHLDKSCGYTINMDTKEQIAFDTKFKVHDPKTWTDMMEIREKEIQSLVT